MAVSLETLEERIKNYHDQVIYKLTVIDERLEKESNDVKARFDKVEARTKNLEDWQRQDAPFINDLRSVRKAFLLKIIDWLVKIVLAAAVVKMGWGFLIH